MAIADTLALVTSGNRVCPLPSRWQDLYELLPDRRRSGSGWEPPLPLILAAWGFTSDVDKGTRLREHVEWAAARGALPAVHEFLARLPEADWHHEGA